MQTLQGQRGLVTGAGSGIGAAIARELAAQGASVVVTDISKEAALHEAERLREEGYSAVGEALDVTEREDLAALSQRLAEEAPPLSILINNAGIGENLPFDDPQSSETWDRTLAINLGGVFNVTYAFLPALKKTRGCVVNISSVVAFTSSFAHAGYAASKGGVRSLTQTLCRELAPHGIRVNAVAPGFIDTPMGGKGDGKTDAWVDWHCPQRRFGIPEEVARPVVFLASPAASFINGVTLPVDGGYLTI
ncbi:MAG: SDR family NAD(P)-dependent oxidoreductase [Rhodovibrionaceae bacterium]